MSLNGILDRPLGERSAQTILDQIPYAVMMGVLAEENPGTYEPLRFVMHASELHMGNPTLPAMHGGAISGFMELASAVHILSFMETARYPKLIDFSIDYLRAARLQTVYALCELMREGRNLTAVQVKAWQDNPAKPVAIARAQFLCADR